MPLVNRKEFASIVGYSPRQVSDWMDQGMPCNRSGKKGEGVEIDTASAIQWLMKRDENQIQSTRLRKAQADRAERENLLERGKLISIELHGEMLQAVTHEFVQMVTGMPGRVAAEIAAISDAAEARQRLLVEVAYQRSSIAKFFLRVADMCEKVRESKEQEQ